jgi:hypothetical protein
MALPIVAGALAVASIGMTLLGAKAQADAIKANAEFQAKIAELNAQLAEIDAANVRRQGAALEARSMTEAAVVKDEQIAAFAAQGIEVKGDATGDLVAQSSLNAELNRMDIQNQAFMAESRLRNEASQRRINAATGVQSAYAQANSAMISGYASALSQGASAGFQMYNSSVATKPTTTTTSTGGLGSGLSLTPREPRTALGNGVSLGGLPNDFGHNHWNNY